MTDGQIDAVNYIRIYSLSLCNLATVGLSQVVSIFDLGFESPPEDGRSDCRLGQFCDSTLRFLYAWISHLQPQQMFLRNIGRLVQPIF